MQGFYASVLFLILLGKNVDSSMGLWGLMDFSVLVKLIPIGPQDCNKAFNYIINLSDLCENDMKCKSGKLWLGSRLG